MTCVAFVIDPFVEPNTRTRAPAALAAGLDDGDREGVEGPPSRICDWELPFLAQDVTRCVPRGRAPGPSQLLPYRRLPPPILGEQP